MELLADRDPEEARQLLDPVLERMMDAVHRYEATVNQVMGDGIIALFGSPIAMKFMGRGCAMPSCICRRLSGSIERRYAPPNALRYISPSSSTQGR